MLLGRFFIAAELKNIKTNKLSSPPSAFNSADLYITTFFISRTNVLFLKVVSSSWKNTNNPPRD